MDVFVILFSVLQVGLGAIYCFAGFRYLRRLMFAYGFVLGGILIYTLITALEGSLIFAVVGGVLGGLLIGWLVYFFYMAGVFLSGMGLGALIGFVITLLTGLALTGIPAIIIICVLAIGGGILAVKLRRPCIIISTSISGAGAIAIYGYMLIEAAFLGGHLPTGIDSLTASAEALAADLPLAALIAALALAIAGIITQFKTAPRELPK